MCVCLCVFVHLCLSVQPFEKINAKFCQIKKSFGQKQKKSLAKNVKKNLNTDNSDILVRL